MQLGKFSDQNNQKGNNVYSEECNIVMGVMGTQQESRNEEDHMIRMSKLIINLRDYKMIGKRVKNFLFGVYWVPSSSCSHRVRA